MSVVANHVELDREHVERGSREIDLLVTSLDKLEPMLDVLRTSISYYEQFWDEILDAKTEAA